MSIGGWFTMILSVGFVVGLFVACVWRVLSEHKTTGQIHGIEDIEKGED